MSSSTLNRFARGSVVPTGLDSFLSPTQHCRAGLSSVAALRLSLFTREVIYRDRILKKRIIARHHGDSAVGHEILLAVGLGIETNRSSLGDVHIAIDNGAANSAMASNVHMREKNAGIDLGIGVHAHVGRQNAEAAEAPGN